MIRLAVVQAVLAAVPVAAQPERCEGRSPRFLALTVVGTISPDVAGGTSRYADGTVQFVDMCQRDRVYGLIHPSEASPSSACVREFGTAVRTTLVRGMTAADGELTGFSLTCVAEPVEAICEALSDCGVPARPERR